jgi:hypothetical protein
MDSITKKYVKNWTHLGGFVYLPINHLKMLLHGGIVTRIDLLMNLLEKSSISNRAQNRPLACCALQINELIKGP